VRPLLAEFTEIESGKRHANWSQLRAVLIIARLDRLARNVAFIANLMDSGAEFVAVDMPTANRLTVHILAAVAEHEREMISQRTKAALAQAKTRGTKLGNPQPLAALAYAKAATAHLKPAPEVLRLIADHRAQGLTFRAIASTLNALALHTPRGKPWYASSVRNMLNAA
jgi:DNA invertase Pin-like site-specific DNA recombinase